MVAWTQAEVINATEAGRRFIGESKPSRPPPRGTEVPGVSFDLSTCRANTTGPEAAVTRPGP
jgi:hypothetical protein